MTRRVSVVPLLAVPVLVAGFVANLTAQQAPDSTPARAEVASGSLPDTVTVGDRFTAVVRVRTAAGVRVAFPPRPDSAADVQALGAPRVRTGAAGEYAAAYPMVAWRPGALAAPTVAIRVMLADGRSEVLRAPLRLPFVRSVLPQDTSRIKIRPRGPRDVLDLAPDWRLLALVAAAALLLLALLVWAVVRWLRRPKRRKPVSVPDARARALAELDRARQMGLVEAGRWKEFYALTSGAVREFLDVVSARWGADLTTEEVVQTVAADEVPAEEVDRLLVVLREADLVKFARVPSSAPEAERHWTEARAWVAGFQPPVVEDDEDVEAEAEETAEVVG
ncbi:MAG: hypothetical protein JO040_11420 [Gemmatimonadetes bacterium]|nr:hypothetical protein [Gemmatimonadota bacterium]